MNDFLASSVEFGAENLGIVYLQGPNEAFIFAISSTRDGLADAVLSHYHNFELDMVEECLTEICELDLPEKDSSGFSIVTGVWAHYSCQALLTIVRNNRIPELSKVIPSLTSESWIFFSCPNTALFLVASKDPKVMQFFSKQQTNMMWEHIPNVTGPEDRIKLEEKIASLAMMDRTEDEPYVWEGASAELLTSIIFLTINLQDLTEGRQQKYPLDLSNGILNRPWKQNAHLN